MITSSLFQLSIFDRKFSFDQIDRDTALNSLYLEHSSSEVCLSFRDPSRSDLEWHIGMK